MRFALTLALFGLLAVTAYGLCNENKDQLTCDSATEGGLPCHWCVSKAVPSSCQNDTNSRKLPASIFLCDNLKAPEPAPLKETLCSDNKDQLTCDSATEGGLPCHWCVSKAVPSSCQNDTNSRKLPASIFLCDNLKFDMEATAVSQSDDKDDLMRFVLEHGHDDAWAPIVSELRKNPTVEHLKKLLSVAKVDVIAPEEPKTVQASGIDPAVIWQIGKDVWEIIQDNTPVVNVSVDFAGAVPSGISDWTALASWMDYESPVYTFQFKNFLGMLLTEFQWVWSFKFNGAYNGVGQYVTGAGAIPKKVYAYLTEHVEVSSKAANPLNYGTPLAPISGLDLQISMKSWGYFESTTVTCSVTVRGDGAYKVISCDQQ